MDQLPVSFAVIVVGTSCGFIAVLCLLIMTSSSRRRCCRSTLATARPSSRPTVYSVSPASLQPRLVAFTAVNHGLGHHDAVKTLDCTDDVDRQTATNRKDQRRRENDHNEPTTSARAKSGYKLERGDDGDAITAVSCLDTRSFSVPAVTDSGANHRATDRRGGAADRATRIATTALSAVRVDSGVFGVQSSDCTLSSLATQQPPELSVEAQLADRVDAAVGTAPVWNLSQMSMDVHSCPAGGSAADMVAVQSPPLLLCQYVNGYSDSMLIHAADRPQRAALLSGNVSRAASTTATHCAADDDDKQPRPWRDIAAETVPASRSGAVTVQTKAVVEQRRTTGDHDANESACVSGLSHDLPQSTLDQYLPPPPRLPSPPPSDACSQPRSGWPLSTYRVHDLPPSFPLPHPPSGVCDQPFDLPPPPGCDRGRLRPSTESPDAAFNVIKVTTPPSLMSEVDRRRLLTRLLQDNHDQLVLSPALYCHETYF